MRIKKILVLLIIAVLLPLFASCGGAQSKKTEVIDSSESQKISEEIFEQEAQEATGNKQNSVESAEEETEEVVEHEAGQGPWELPLDE